MSVREILLLGDKKLYEVSKEVSRDDMEKARQVVSDLHDTILDFRKRYGFGRAIAAPQIGEFFRILYLNFNNESTAFINPRLEFIGDEKFEMWDDCMSFPGLEVRLMRYKNARIYYKDLKWNDCVMELQGDLSELLQHEYDHLDGILAVDRALDKRSFRINRDKAGCF